MAGFRRIRLPAVLLFLFILVLLYITTAKRTTYSSQFYSRTVAAINDRQRHAEARADVLAGEKARQDRVTRLQDEHDIAMGRTDADKLKNSSAQDSRPLSASLSAEEEGQKPVAGRKLMKDGKVVVDETGTQPNGVAQVGNVPAKAPTDGAAKATDDEKEAEEEMNIILKKGPIIVFSKTHCPYSKQAKNILQDIYNIVPPPYVVELDTHPMGALLQASLKKTTGRGTVPNILVTGKSIGGGDDIQQLHRDGKLIETIKSLGGKRIMEMKLVDKTTDHKKAVR